MIKVNRLPKPKILKEKGEEWTKDLLGAETEPKRKRAEKKYRHREIKKTLVRMFHGKCAYCESKITHIDYGHIEHYRPKGGESGRPDLTFNWDNLLLACGVCNGSGYKSDRFPEMDQNGPLVNPCDDDPDEHFQFYFDAVTRLASVFGKSSRGETTEKVLGLNRPELRAYRSRAICRLVALARLGADDPEAAQMLQEAKNSAAEYAAFARTLFP